MPTFSKPSGYYVFRPANRAITFPPEIAQNKLIAGWVIRGEWATVQPSKAAACNFSRELSAAKQIAAQGKQYMLEVFGGAPAPAWTGGINAQFDEPYLKAYESLVAAMGKAFSGDPNLVAVHCCCPMNTSPEFRLDGTTLVKAGWVNAALAANSRALLALAKAFPRQTIVVDLHNPSGNASDGFVPKQIEQGKQLLGKQFAIQENAFNAKPDQQKYNLYQCVQQHRVDGYSAGYEQVQASTDPKYGGTFSQSLPYLGKAQWLIIYEPDAANIKKPWGAK